MAATAQDAYLENRVLSADPLELVRMLYRSTLDSTRNAKAHLAAGRIPERCREISRAMTLITELAGSLDRERGGAISENLAGLYDYMQRRLLEANMRKNAEPLSEVESLLATLLEGWEQARPAVESASDTMQNFEPEPSSPSHHTAYGAYALPQLMSDAAVEYSAQSWSF